MSVTSNLFQESLQFFPGTESEQPSLDITVGCEFEFLLVCYDEEPQDHELSPKYIWQDTHPRNVAATAPSRMRIPRSGGVVQITPE
jgi:hypothetical protein